MKFFSNTGLTTTSANHIANLAKEFIQSNLESLENIQFYDEGVKLLVSNQITSLSKGCSDISSYPDKIKDIINATSLCAWLREAIKKKDNLINSLPKIAEEKFPVPQCPISDEFFTEEDYLETLTEEQLFNYYKLNATASVLGKFIHKDCPLNEARKQLFTITNFPNKIEGKGQEAMVYYRKPCIDSKEVDEFFFELQNKHREAQAQLNKIKYNGEQYVNDHNTEIEFKERNSNQEYNEQLKIRRQNIQDYINTEKQKIRDYKIVIPDSLKSIYEKINKLGK